MLRSLISFPTYHTRSQLAHINCAIHLTYANHYPALKPIRSQFPFHGKRSAAVWVWLIDCLFFFVSTSVCQKKGTFYAQLCWVRSFSVLCIMHKAKSIRYFLYRNVAHYRLLISAAVGRFGFPRGTFTSNRFILIAWRPPGTLVCSTVERKIIILVGQLNRTWIANSDRPKSVSFAPVHRIRMDCRTISNNMRTTVVRETNIETHGSLRVTSFCVVQPSGLFPSHWNHSWDEVNYYSQMIMLKH